MVVFDSTMLLLLFRPGTRVPGSISFPRERIEALVAELEKGRTRVVIPTPALSELLIRAGQQASEEIVHLLEQHATFRIEPFDTIAAIELAAMGRADLKKPKSKRDDAATYAKLKYDRQIVAIAKIHGASAIYSDDGDLRRLAIQEGISVVGLADLPLPEAMNQHELFTGPRLVAENAAPEEVKAIRALGAPSKLLP